MKLPVLLLLLALAASFRAHAQQLIRLPEGDFMDTVQTAPAADCPGRAVYRYYMLDAKYPRSSATLAQEAQTFVTQAFVAQRGEAPGGTGWVTFRFVVGCGGRRHRQTQVLQTDAHYHVCQFAPALLAALYAYLQTLTEWKPARTKAGEPVKYLAYLTFKLEDGKVVAVAP